MARYKPIDTSPRFLPVDLERQLLPGSFEHALNYLVDHELDLSAFDARYRNDCTGATAYPPALLLKIVLFAYSRGIVSSRAIERACREQVTFIALCGDCAPHFTTIADFVSTLGEDTARLFAQVLTLCDRLGLIGRTMFAIDGVKLASNASKTKSGRRTDFLRQAKKMEAAAQHMLARHRATDALPIEPELAEKASRQVKALQAEANQLRTWLAAHPVDRPGARGKPRLSNRTDNESAKMATDKGVIQESTTVSPGRKRRRPRDAKSDDANKNCAAVPAPFPASPNVEKGVFLQPQRRGDRRCAALSRSVQRPKGARLSAGLAIYFTL